MEAIEVALRQTDKLYVIISAGYRGWTDVDNRLYKNLKAKRRNWLKANKAVSGIDNEIKEIEEQK